MNLIIVKTENPYRKGSLITADILVLASFDQLLSIMQTLLNYLQNKLPQASQLFEPSTSDSDPGHKAQNKTFGKSLETFC